MSDVDDDLLALLAAPSSKTKRKPSKATSNNNSKGNNNKPPTKKKKKNVTPATIQDDDSASDMEMSNSDDEETNVPNNSTTAGSSRKGKNTKSYKNQDDSDEEDGEEETLLEFPLEGKYIDHADRAKIQAMSELDRESILGERSAKLLEEQSRKELRRMVKAKERGVEAVIRSTRDRQVTGASKTKENALAKLKKKRLEKGKKKDNNSNNSPKRKRDDSEDYENNDDDNHNEEDSNNSEGELSDGYGSGGDGGKSSKGKNSRSTRSTPAKKESSSNNNNSKKEKEVEEFIPQNLRDVMVTRERMVPFLNAPWFGEWIKGSWVRYLSGQSNGIDKPVENIYRLSNVIGIREGGREPYKVDSVSTTIEVKLEHAGASGWFTLEGTSNSPPTIKEIERVVAFWNRDGIKPPSYKAFAEIKKNLDARKEYTMSEADLIIHLAKKSQNKVNPFQSKAKLLIQRDFARSTNNLELLASTEAALLKLEPVKSLSRTGSLERVETESERMSKVNERNRKQDREEIKKYEAKSMEERRKAAESLRRGESIKIDASARVKTMTRLTYDRASESRPATPAPATPNTGLISSPAVAIVASETLTPSAERTTSTFEKMVNESVEVDVDLDF